MAEKNEVDLVFEFLSRIKDLGPSIKSDEVKAILGEDDHRLLVDILKLAYKKVYDAYGATTPTV